MIEIMFGYYNDEDFGLTEYPDIRYIDEKNIDEKNSIYFEETKEIKERLEEYRKFLITGIMEDFQYSESCEEVLEEIKNIENDKKNRVEWDGQAFQYEITKHYVQFIHTIFGESEEYPIWVCRLKDYKKVLQTWKKFLEMPRDIDSKIKVNI